MTEKYDAESKKLQNEIEEIENHFSAVDTRQINTEMFIKSIRKYRDIRKLTPQSVSDSIDKIVVGKRQNIDSVLVQQFDIYYRFVVLISPTIKKCLSEVLSSELTAKHRQQSCRWMSRRTADRANIG